MKMYYVSKTILGGNPDRNRRTIYESEVGRDGKPMFSTEHAVCTINQDMQVWDHRFMRLQDVILATLREMDRESAAHPTGT